METASRVEAALEAEIARAAGAKAPPKLAAALRHAVFPGGGRVRPLLLLAVGGANGDPAPALSDSAAAALELLHCASLVHDDMPCFDNADIRRGKATVHRAYGEPLALLAGDTLIVAAFEDVARAAGSDADRAVSLIRILARPVPMLSWGLTPSARLRSPGVCPSRRRRLSRACQWPSPSTRTAEAERGTQSGSSA
mgnify:CR=1 FL=1